jgi:hypothetical protein
MQRFVFWMQQSHDQSQPSLSLWQCKFIVVEAGIIITNYIFMATYKHQMQRMIFSMQQPHQLSQQILHSRQPNFIVAIGMYYRNQLNICGNKHISIATLN